MRPLLALAFALVAALPAVAQAPAQTCGTHDFMVQWLGRAYGEGRIWLGMGTEVVLEIYANPETQTWTMLFTRPGLPTCMMAAGTVYEVLTDLPRNDDPA